MASAYAALVALQHIIDKIQKHHASHIKSIGDNPSIVALRKRANSLQNHFETYHNSRPRGHNDYDDGDVDAARPGLESRIAHVVYAAEDVLESHIVDRIHAVQSSSITDEENTSINHFHQCLEKVIRDMELIEEELKSKIKSEKSTEATKDLDGQTTNNISGLRPSSSSTLPPSPNNAKNAEAPCMVGFDDYRTQIKGKLTFKGQGVDLQIITISGMGGIGKTTLARNVYEDPIVKRHFDNRAWSAISQQFSVRKILLDLLEQVSGGLPEQDNREVRELGDDLHKKLWRKRYLIILDDMWSIKAWEEVMSYFPDNNNGSRIVVTTRESNMASQLGSSYAMQMDFLSDYQSWTLLYQKVFGGELRDFPDVELEKLGKKIAQKCGGLPLSIVTIGGLLAKSDKTTEYWGVCFGKFELYSKLG